ncbi:MAG: hypothetical protein HY726_20965 [Candidatus Rokubacteria bacterium]|nr:hypothetical protein [Candidatus Rokubacteria bacterium]
MDRDATFAQVLRLVPGRTALIVVDMQKGFRCVVVEDGVATLWPEIQRATLDIIRRAYARVASAKEVADEMALW